MPRTFTAAAILLGIGLTLPACAAFPTQQTNESRGYLEQAQQAAQARQPAQTLAALDRAENAWLAAEAPAGNPIVHHERPALREIALARGSVQAERWGDADYYISAALTHPSDLGG